MRCSECGYESKTEGERFCGACGKPLGGSSANTHASASSEPVNASSPTSFQSNSTDPAADGGGAGNSKFGFERWRPLGWLVLAAILYLTIADAAVESFIRGSPLRWYIAGAAILYLGSCAALWRLKPLLWARSSWANQAATSFLVLLALLTASAWLPDGLERGLSLFGQPTSTVLAILSAAVVAICGVLLARLAFVPLAGKIAIGLLTAYGVVAFLLALKSGTPYASLFHGGSVWTGLPVWLQGAVVGGLFVVPVAIALEVVTGLQRITRPKIPGFTVKVITLGMGLAIALAAVRLPVDVATTTADTSTNTSAPTSENHESPPADEASYKQASEQINKLYAALDVVNGKLDRSLFEIDALAARLGSDPAVLFHFVRDEIRYEPYVGVLRGPLGTLICRAGNSLDRSLLLAALLQKAGFRSQIAAGHLDMQAAKLLVGRLFEPEKPGLHAISLTQELVPEISNALGIDTQQFQKVADAVRQSANDREKKLTEYVGTESTFLSNLLSKSGVDPGALTTSERLVREASEHYWVQYQNSEGQWVDLDSSFLGAEPGKVSAQTNATLAPDSIPDELYHHLRITLTLRVAEVANGNSGTTTDTDLIDQELRVADQQGVDILLANQPSPMLDPTKRR